MAHIRALQHIMTVSMPHIYNPTSVVVFKTEKLIWKHSGVLGRGAVGAQPLVRDLLNFETG